MATVTLVFHALITLVCVPLAILGLFIAHELIFRRKNFIALDGQIVSAGVETNEVMESTHLSICVVCEYDYLGKKYRGSPSVSKTYGRNASELLARTAERANGADVRVFCDPDKPKNFVIDHRVTGGEILIAVLLLGFGFGVPALLWLA